jgi:hypothetical protein
MNWNRALLDDGWAERDWVAVHYPTHILFVPTHTHKIHDSNDDDGRQYY